jgi:hypothetical protein
MQEILTKHFNSKENINVKSFFFDNNKYFVQFRLYKAEIIWGKKAVTTQREYIRYLNKEKAQLDFHFYKGLLFTLLLLLLLLLLLG